MIRRLRTLSGMLALVALTFSMAEGVRVSVCSSMEAPPAAAALFSDLPGSSALAGSEAPQSAAADDESHRDGLPCPLGPMGMSGGCMTATVPPARTADLPFLPRIALIPTGVERHPDALLVRDLFRPPRA